jgi:hypothetical protein
VAKNFRTILGAMMPAKVTIFSGGGPELCFILLSLFHQERAFEKREHRESFIVSTRRWFRCARARAQKSESVRERKRNITRPICFDGRSRVMILPGKKRNDKEQHNGERNTE